MPKLRNTVVVAPLLQVLSNPWAPWQVRKTRSTLMHVKTQQAPSFPRYCLTIERVSSNNSANTSWHWILRYVNFFFQTISCMLIGRKYDIKVVMNSTGITLSASYKITTTNIFFNFTGQRFVQLYKYRYGFSLLQSNALTNAQSTWNLQVGK